jgi:hypothetical protein
VFTGVDQLACEICKRGLTWNDFHADHIKPI